MDPHERFIIIKNAYDYILDDINENTNEPTK